MQHLRIFRWPSVHSPVPQYREGQVKPAGSSTAAGYLQFLPRRHHAGTEWRVRGREHVVNLNITKALRSMISPEFPLMGDKAAR
jgi:hypothetical protein